jgi:hypothetical protein
VDEDIIIPLAGMLTSVVIVLGIPLVIVYARRLWKRDTESAAPSSHETNMRLERIEHAIDAMAVEVERISESQRFVSKALSERPAERVAIAAPQEQRRGN